MAFDAHGNFVASTVAVAPSPATSGLSLTVQSGHGAIFPTAPFNCTVNGTGTPEIVRVTGIVGDVLTIQRHQEGTTARAIAVGDLIALTLTAKCLEDIETAIRLVSIVAEEDIPAFSAVTSLGEVADSGNPSGAFGKVIGVVPAAIEDGFSGDVIESGEVENPDWSWTAGDLVFLNGTNLSTSPPVIGFVQAIGTALGPTILLVDLQTPILI